MPFSVAEAARLEKAILREGSRADSNWEALVLSACEWYAAERKSADPTLTPEVLAFLCETIRSADDLIAKQLAAGVLLLAQQEQPGKKHGIAFAARFAMGRIKTLTQSRLGWTSISLSEKDRQDALALFDAAKEDRSYTVSELVENATLFVRQYQNDSGIFGKLASDLSFLIQMISRHDLPAAQEEVARAALTYFAVSSDAIPDDLGFVGLIDDVFVVKHALALIDPSRATFIEQLDQLIIDWPFVREVQLWMKGLERSRRLTEFELFHSMLIQHAIATKNSVAVVGADPKRIRTIVGFIAGLATTREHIGTGSLPDFKQGEKLTNVEGEAVVLFDTYGTLNGTTFLESSLPHEITHFRFLARKPGRQKTLDAWNVKCIRPISDIGSFRRSDEDRAGRGGSAIFAPDSVPLGVLERLLASPRPIVLPPKRSTVLVVGALGESRQFLADTRLFAKSLLDVLPTGQYRVAEDGPEFSYWSATHDSHPPVLAFVRTTADAVAVTDGGGSVCAVISNVDADSSDATNLTRISSQGLPVLGFVRTSDYESAGQLSEKGYRFWQWSTHSLERLTKTEANDDLAIEERCLRESLWAKTKPLEVTLPGLVEAHSALQNLHSHVGERDDEMLRLAVGEGFSTLVRICRTIMPVNGTRVELQRSLDDFSSSLKRGSGWWPKEIVSLGEAAFESLRFSFLTLCNGNPKYEALREWLEDNPGAYAIGRCDQHHEMASRFSTHVPHGSSKVILPAWLNRDRMSRFLFPPAVSEVALLLYGPEQQWFAAAERRDVNAQSRTRAFVRKSPVSSGNVPKDEPFTTTKLDPVFEPDAVVIQTRRLRALEYMKTVNGEPVSARLVHFGSGHWAAFTEMHRVYTITHLLERGNEQGEDQIRETLPDQLQIGDRVLLLTGTDRDLLRDEVDKVAPSGCRHSAAAWQRALRKYSRQCSVSTLVERLSKMGCNRTPATIQHWLHDDLMIAPRSETDLHTILAVTDDDGLRAELRNCVEAVKTLRSLHLKIAIAIGRRVLTRAKDWLESGAAADELLELEDQLVLVTVESVDSEPISVPRPIANRLQEPRSYGRAAGAGN